MQDKKYIAIFDSGLGGLTVVKALSSLLPNENILFYGDSKNMPYGSKSQEDIIKLAIDDLSFITKFNLKAIVVGCNTIDSIAIDKIKNNYNIPIYRIIEPTCIAAAKTTKNKNIAVMATEAAVKSQSYLNKLETIDKSIKVTSIACYKFTELIESGKKDSDEMQQAIIEYIKPIIENNCDTLILGCTHYPIIEDKIKAFLPNINIISSSLQAALNLKTNLKVLNKQKEDELYYVSEIKDSFTEQANILLNKEIEIKIAK